MKSVVQNLACFFLLSVLPLSASAQPTGFVPAWLNDGSPISDSDLNTIVQSVGAQQANPDHIAIMIHGLGNTRDDSTSQFNALGPLLTAQYTAANKKVVVVGVQWDSGADMNLFNAEDVYLSMVGRARKTGHWPTRQVLLRLQQAYPKASFDIYAHSLGCEVTAACMVPQIEYTDDIAKSQAFEPTQNLHVNMITLAGSDLNYNVWSQSHVDALQKQPLVKKLWMTMSPYVGEDDQDQVLQLRAMVRGVAGGSAFPSMTKEQYKVLLGGNRLVIDNQDIPTDHAFLKYYNEARLTRVVPLAVHVADPSFPEPKEFDDLNMARKMPDQVAALQPYLDSPHLTTVMYTLWRMEQMLCGNNNHLGDGTIEKMARLLKNQPSLVRVERKSSPCKDLSNGYFPAENQLIRAGAPNW